MQPLHLHCVSSAFHCVCSFSDEEEEEEETFCLADPTRFITDPDFCYQEFARREEDHFQVFRVQVGLLYLLIGVSCNLGFYYFLFCMRVQTQSMLTMLSS